MKMKKRLAADREIFQTLDRQQRLLFIWDYYKIPILAAASAVILTLMVLLTWAGKKDVAMYAVFVNSDAAVAQTKPELLDELLASNGIDMDGKSIGIQTYIKKDKEMHTNVQF